MIKLIVVVYILLWGNSTLYAASTDNIPLQNEQQRQIYERLQNIDTTIPSSQSISPESNLTKDDNETVCFQTISITIRNITLLSNEDQNLSIDPYLGQCNGIRSLSSLADSLTKQYIDKGYITSRVYLVPQDIADGSVELFALEGKIAHVVSDKAKTSGAFMGLEGESLYLGDLESSIAQVNRLRSNKTA